LGRNVEGTSYPILAQYTTPKRLFSWMQEPPGGYYRATALGTIALGADEVAKLFAAAKRLRDY